jgi:hypothetical protein
VVSLLALLSTQVQILTPEEPGVDRVGGKENVEGDKCC